MVEHRGSVLNLIHPRTLEDLNLALIAIATNYQLDDWMNFQKIDSEVIIKL